MVWTTCATLSNNRPKPLTVYSEPDGADYTLTMNESLDVRVSPSTEGFSLEICFGEEYAQVFASGKRAFDIGFFQKTKRLECGHNRHLAVVGSGVSPGELAAALCNRGPLGRTNN